MNQDDVTKLVSTLATKNSSGHDGISLKLLKFLSPVLIKPLTLIINQSLITGIFPTKLKIAKVLPYFKKDDIMLMDNYRPISLLTSTSKVFEKVLVTQLFDYFQKNSLFYPNQYGFRKLHSTEFAALELTDRILKDIDENIYITGYFHGSFKGLRHLKPPNFTSKIKFLWDRRHSSWMVFQLSYR